MKKLDKIKIALKGLLVEFGSVSTDKGTLSWGSDDEIAVDTEVYMVDADGNRNPVEDGEYTDDENKKIYVITDSIVKEIRDIEEPEEPAEEPAPEAPAEEPVAAEDTPAEEPEVENPDNEGEESETDAIVALRKEVDELFKVVDALVKRVDAIEGKGESEEFSKMREEVDALNAFKATVEKMSAAPTAHQEFMQQQTIATGKSKELDAMSKLFQN